MNARTALALREITDESASLDDLWTCLNIIEDYSAESDDPDSVAIHAAVMRAQNIARNMENKP